VVGAGTGHTGDDVGAEMIAVAVVEDHPVFRKGLVQVIEAAPDLQLTVASRSVEELDAGGGALAQVVLLDLHLPGLRGAPAVAHLCARGHTVLVVSASEAPADVVDLTKQTDEAEIVGAIRAVAEGRTYVSATLASYLLQAPIHITEREREILELVAGGETDQDIAELLQLSVRTVHSHLDRIRNKTGSRRRADLTRFALERGIVPRSPK
jgi:DNA-binding NarL/FixJ family response regulator